MATKKRNPQDITRRNLVAAKKREAAIIRHATAMGKRLERRIDGLERRLARLEARN